jgi:glycosyltransferase involved in cell wall biosynthesis
MRLMFVYWQPDDAGSAQTIVNYTEAARALGHEVVLYGPEDEASRFRCSLDVESADAVVFLLEWNLYLPPGDLKAEGRRRTRDGLMGIGHFNLVQLLSKVPRARRVVIDDDGMYNDVIHVGGDYNHLDAEASRRRIELYDSLADKIYQPTPHPLRPNVGTFFFHAYDPAWERPLDFRAKAYGMVYVGNNWFRWRAMQQVLRAIEPIRDEVGRIGLVGRDWGAMPFWVESPLREAAYYTDPDYLNRLGVEIMPPVPVDQVVDRMSQGVFNPVLVRPVFNHLRLVNPRLFETPAANTIPLFCLDRPYVQEIYGAQAGELVLAADPAAASEQIVDVLRRPDEYADIVRGIRRHLAAHHSYEVRLRELIGIVTT